MLFYGKYENGRRYICAYDEKKHGAPRVVANDLTFVYHNSISVNRVYKTEREAMAGSWSKYSNKPVMGWHVAEYNLNGHTLSNYHFGSEVSVIKSINDLPTEAIMAFSDKKKAA